MLGAARTGEAHHRRAPRRRPGRADRSESRPGVCAGDGPPAPAEGQVGAAGDRPPAIAPGAGRSRWVAREGRSMPARRPRSVRVRKGEDPQGERGGAQLRGSGRDSAPGARDQGQRAAAVRQRLDARRLGGAAGPRHRSHLLAHGGARGPARERRPRAAAGGRDRHRSVPVRERKAGQSLRPAAGDGGERPHRRSGEGGRAPDPGQDA